ncbi:SDR family NAD(P)-dependent oxidoreductase [Spirosoma sp. KCTC 42546]|uniref:SDR family NAD(P)-dependent oxidoreductase n=1 Tax=Spirosoma sp. KCTC 42546 TaxID=2520506 RepID=UPI001157FF00|nr:SDR family NAD(P)-dependent oxidoreductase [Spirosoma sp. KCTC 42546]QDK77848.1 SDR family NAD(P)-dependent oxidoreductase [Spirosoma sp. KCTC 42546]
MKSVPKTILITGVSTGIGYGAAKHFLQRGYTVFGSVRTQTDADRLQAEFGEAFTPLRFDVTDADAVAKAAHYLTERLAGSGLGGLINNAGIAIGGPLQDQPMDVFRKHFDVNVIGLVQVTQAFLPLLGARENHPVLPGRILNISSVNGQVAIPFMGAYVGSKHAVEGLSHSLRRELSLLGIKVVIVGPGAVQTPIWGKGTDMSPYANTPYYPAMQRFLKQVAVSERKGFSIDYLGQRIVEIYETEKPRIRYALVPGKLMGWILPRLLPARVLDWVLERI